jgi:hypothetical protein
MRFRWLMAGVLFLQVALCGGGPGAAATAPESPPATLEDIYGPTGDRFQAALGMLNFENFEADDPVTGYGVGVDDVVFSWKEINLVLDQTECLPGGAQPGGACAAVQLQTTNFYESRSRLAITVLDAFPSVNNCNDDHVCSDNAQPCDPFAADTGCAPGATCDDDYGDVGIDDFDCDDDGTPDVRVEAKTDAELGPGEYVVLECTNSTGMVCESNEYREELPVSAAGDAPGVLFGVPLSAGDLPAITVTYRDTDDGTGAPCSNNVDPALHGVVQATTTMFLDVGNVVVNVAEIVSDNGDDDPFADTGELVELAVSVLNKTGMPLTNVTAQLMTDDPKIACIFDGLARLGSLDPGEEMLSSLTGENFVFRVADTADRLAAGLDEMDDYSVTFQVTVRADQFDAAMVPQDFTLDLDLDATGGGVPDGGYWEDFEASAGLGSFTTMNLDLGIQDGDPFADSDGWRCQYNDPDWVNSNSYGQITDCFVGASPIEADAYYWQIHRTTDIDGGRAFSGSQSLYNGIFGPAADEHTTPLGNMEAAGSSAPINLAVETAPILSFYQQVHFYLRRQFQGMTNNRGVVQVQLADQAGNPSGPWVTLEPYFNPYDSDVEFFITNCTFDPVDDGNTEDDFFDPADPDRRYGPSSTCYPQRGFAWTGDTFDPFDGDLGRAMDGPGLPGSLGVGTWVESRVNLQRFRGRRIRLRWLSTHIKVGGIPTNEALFAINPSPEDDGWWIDDVRIDQTLDAPVTLVVDLDPPPGSPVCAGLDCTAVGLVADLAVVEPAGFAGSSPVPGRALTLSAEASTAAACVGGVYQYRFWSDDVLLRDFTDDPRIVVSPTRTANYSAEVRCTTVPECVAVTSSTVIVDCPKTGALTGTVFAQTILADRTGDEISLSWASPADVDVVGGALASYPNASIFRSAEAVQAMTISTSATDAWFLVRDRGEFCNNSGSWNTDDPAQMGDRDTILP